MPAVLNYGVTLVSSSDRVFWELNAVNITKGAKPLTNLAFTHLI
jgi:hypothetical protein